MKILTKLMILTAALSLTGCSLLENILKKAENAAENNANDYNGTLRMSREESEAKLDAAAKSGYYVSFEYDYSGDSGADRGSFDIGNKGDTFWINVENTNQSETGYAFVTVNAGIEMYQYDLDAGGYVYMGTDTSGQNTQTLENLKQGYKGWIYWANTYDGQLKKGNDEMVIGRSCYTYTIRGLQKAEYKVWVDKEFGITLKLDFDATIDGQHTWARYQMNEFLLGNEVHKPTLYK